MLRCIIISDECLVVAGLRYFLKETGLFTTIEHEFSLQNIINEQYDSDIFIFLEYKLIPDPKTYTLEKLHRNNENCNIIALHSKEPDIELLPYFRQVITSKHDEKEINFIIRQLLQPFRSEDQNDSEGISEREREILRYVALGKTNKEISDQLNISIHTVITHRKNITAKLGIKTIAGLTVYAIINGIIDPDECK